MDGVTRRWIVIALVVVAAAAIGGGLALALNGDGRSDDARSSSTTASTRAVASTATSAPSTATTATAAPTATAATTAPARSRDSVPELCGAEQAAISAAIAASVGSASPTVIAQCRFAASDRRWIVVLLDDQATGGATVLLVQENGAWRVVARGTDNVGCGLAPQGVLVDLGLLCIGSGGG